MPKAKSVFISSLSLFLLSLSFIYTNTISAMHQIPCPLSKHAPKVN